MKSHRLLPGLALIAMMLGACAGPAATAVPTDPPEPTQAPTQPPPEPTALPPTAESPTEPAGPTRVQITLADNTVSASMTSFQAGIPYTFVVSNTGRREHNFNISPPVSVAGSLDAALAGAMLALDETQLPPGGATSIDFTFPESAVGAQLEFNCLIRRHYDDGMRLEITVTG